MASSPPGSWPDQTDIDAAPASLKTRPRQSSLEGGTKGEQLSNKPDKMKAPIGRRTVELPPEILEQSVLGSKPMTWKRQTLTILRS